MVGLTIVVSCLCGKLSKTKHAKFITEKSSRKTSKDYPYILSKTPAYVRNFQSLSLAFSFKSPSGGP